MLIDSSKSQYICKMQVDYDIFDSFGHFAVFIQNLGGFLFRYELDRVSIPLSNETVYILFILHLVQKFEKQSEEEFLIYYFS